MSNPTKIKEICPTTTQSWLQRGALLVDVREPNEVDSLAFDVPDLLHIPLSDFEERYTEIPQDREVVMVCQVGQRSLRAAGFLVNHGYDPERVVNMQYGLNRWVAKGFPVKGDPSVVENNGGGCCGSAAPQKEATACCGDTQSTQGSKCC